jgi:hypothetical protein
MGCGGDTVLMERALGIAQGRLSNGDTVIAWIRPEDLQGLRFPNGNEGPVNSSWIPGGFVPGGNREAILNLPNNLRYTPITLGN